MLLSIPPASLSSVVGKKLESIITRNIREHLEKHSQINDSRFMKGRSCLTNLFSIYNKVFVEGDSDSLRQSGVSGSSSVENLVVDVHKMARDIEQIYAKLEKKKKKNGDRAAQPKSQDDLRDKGSSKAPSERNRAVE